MNIEKTTNFKELEKNFISKIKEIIFNMLEELKVVLDLKIERFGLVNNPRYDYMMKVFKQTSKIQKVDRITGHIRTGLIKKLRMFEEVMNFDFKSIYQVQSSFKKIINQIYYDNDSEYSKIVFLHKNIVKQLIDEYLQVIKNQSYIQGDLQSSISIENLKISFIKKTKKKVETFAQILINYNIDFKQTNQSDSCIFDYLCKTKNKKFVKIVLNKNPNFQMENAQYNKAILYGCKNNQTRLVQFFIKNNLQVNVADEENITPLIYAIYNKNYKLTSTLLQNNAKVNAQTDQGLSPLILACVLEQVKIIRLLFKYGVDVNQQNKYKLTPLMYACSMGNSQIVDILLKNGADKNSICVTGYTPLMFSCRKYQQLFVYFVNKKFGNISVLKYCSLRFLEHQSKKPNYLKIVNLLNLNQDQVNKKNDEGYTPLLLACASSNFDIVQYLLSKGADIFCKLYGSLENPLLVTCGIGVTLIKVRQRKNIEYIIEQNQFGFESKQYIFFDEDNFNICKFLVQKMVQIDAQDNQGSTALVYSVIAKYRRLFDFLLQNHSNIYLKNNQNDSAIIFAAKQKNYYCLYKLIQKGFNIYETNKQGQCAISFIDKQYKQQIMDFYKEQKDKSFQLISKTFCKFTDIFLCNHINKCHFDYIESFPSFFDIKIICYIQKIQYLCIFNIFYNLFSKRWKF